MPEFFTWMSDLQRAVMYVQSLTPEGRSHLHQLKGGERSSGLNMDLSPTRVQLQPCGTETLELTLRAAL